MAVITIAYNDMAGLRLTRQSVQEQTVSMEHIIVDGGSSDDTRKYLESLEGVNWSSVPDRGRYHAMNIGIERASADLVWLMHAGDTFAHPDTAQRVLFDHASSGWSWAYGFSRIVGTHGSLLGFAGYAPFELRRYSLGGKVIPHQAAIFTKGLHERLGGYDESFGLAADQLYMLRAASIAEPRIIPDFLCNFDATGAGSSRGIFPHYRDMTRSRRASGISATGSIIADSCASWGLAVIAKATQVLSTKVKSGPE